MDTLATVIWNPFMCFFYILMGVLFLWQTDFIAWKKTFGVVPAIILGDKSRLTEKVIPHLKGFLTMLSTMVGVGNLAGVATAIHLGGPGAVFWMWVSAFLGMSFRMISTYLSMKSAPKNLNNPAYATPMAYLEKLPGTQGKSISLIMAWLTLFQGAVLAILIQGNSLAQALSRNLVIPEVVTALLITLVTGLVISGGTKKIVNFASMATPFFVIFYVLAGLSILLMNPLTTFKNLVLIFYAAFSSSAVTGGVVGYTVLSALQFGMSRGIFSHGSGMGGSTFFQAANEDDAAAGAFMSALTPFVDTVIICTITALVILNSSFWLNETGAYLTLISFNSVLGVTGDWVVLLSLLFFAITTITGFELISEKCFRYLGGDNTTVYRIVFLLLVFLGPFFNLMFVWALADILIAATLLIHLFPLFSLLLKNQNTINGDLVRFAEPQGAVPGRVGTRPMSPR